ncbi:MAG: hypothetical protein KKF02_07250, partial [Proteobacteria bacterium]|nr:hypothetical protein [Pseudomonadota bacterium]
MRTFIYDGELYEEQPSMSISFYRNIKIDSIAHYDRSLGREKGREGKREIDQPLLTRGGSFPASPTWPS